MHFIYRGYMRRDSREAVYKIIYADIFNGENDEQFKKDVYSEQNLNDADAEFADRLLNAIEEHRGEIERNISELANGYKYERIYSTDKSALILAFAELAYFDDIPSVVSIDEALSLVRKYSTPESLNYVNGILAAYKRKLETDENN